MNRTFDRFSFGLDGKGAGGMGGDVGVEEEEAGMNFKKGGKEAYGMKGLSTVDSRESLREVEHDGKSLVVEAEPKHCLGQAK